MLRYAYTLHKKDTCVMAMLVIKLVLSIISACFILAAVLKIPGIASYSQSDWISAGRAQEGVGVG